MGFTIAFVLWSISWVYVCMCVCAFLITLGTHWSTCSMEVKEEVLFFSFNFSCCKAHDFCELNLVKPDKCGGNFRNIDQRFEYDAATDTCSEYYQYFLWIISVLSFVVVCIILPKSLASTFLTVIFFVSVTLYDKDWPWEHGRKSPNNS